MANSTHHPNAGKLPIRERQTDKRRQINDGDLPAGRRYIGAVYWVVGILLLGLIIGLFVLRPLVGGG